MNKYIDISRVCFKNFQDCLKNKRGTNITPKEILKHNAKLLVVENNSIIETIHDIQLLYLYPITILDYIKALIASDDQMMYNNVMINIIDINYNIDYIKYFNKKNFKNLKNIEISLPDESDEEKYNKIIEIIEYFYQKKIYISLNIKNLINIPISFIEKICRVCSYFKIFLPPILNTPEFAFFEEKIKFINRYMNSDSLLHIKTYINIEQSKYYKKTILKFKKMNIDIFQVSKELIPINKKNKPVDIQTQNLIRNLEKKYNNYDSVKFISVKDISTLYYPRFELDQRNSKNCYACMMKPYLYNNYVLPCKVKKIMQQPESWCTEKINACVNFETVKKCGLLCDDCASIFENDILDTINKIIKTHDIKKLKFIIELED